MRKRKRTKRIKEGELHEEAGQKEESERVSAQTVVCGQKDGERKLA
jgi:hypothetical protein